MSLLLVVDAGNTNVTMGVFESERLVASWRTRTVHGQTSDEFTLLVLGLLGRDAIDPRQVTASVLASVVPPLTEALRSGIERLFGSTPLVVRPGVKTGMRILTDHPDEVGADRIVNAVAAFERLHAPAIVVDFGTATTFDCISAAGEYLGGVIAPGLGISAEALFQRAARLPRVEVARPARVLGKSTVSAIQSGLYHGYAGLVDGVLDKLLEELGGSPAILATGGLAELIAPASRHIREIAPDLTLEGLRILHDRNK